jgi:hypothetical protein
MHQQAKWDELRGREERTTIRRAERMGGERARTRRTAMKERTVFHVYSLGTSLL